MCQLGQSVRGPNELAFFCRTGFVIMERQFATPNLDVGRRLETEANLPALDFQDGDYDLIPDHDAFANLATQY
jgi:hypothetical protein